MFRRLGRNGLGFSSLMAVTGQQGTQKGREDEFTELHGHLRMLMVEAGSAINE